MDNFKHIHIGKMIEKRIVECEISTFRICNFLVCNENDLKNICNSSSIDTYVLLRLSKLLEYDFFRIYTQHLILYSPHEAKSKITISSQLPSFRKNIYTKVIIDFIIEKIEKQKLTKSQVVERYGIPKTTLYQWIKKYGKTEI